MQGIPQICILYVEFTCCNDLSQKAINHKLPTLPTWLGCPKPNYHYCKHLRHHSLAIHLTLLKMPLNSLFILFSTSGNLRKTKPLSFSHNHFHTPPKRPRSSYWEIGNKHTHACAFVVGQWTSSHWRFSPTLFLFYFFLSSLHTFTSQVAAQHATLFMIFSVTCSEVSKCHVW